MRFHFTIDRQEVCNTLVRPAERGQWIPGGAGLSDELQGLLELKAGQLHVGAAVTAMAQGGERVGAIAGVEVTAGLDQCC